MTDTEKLALAQELHTPRGRVLLTFLKELAFANALDAMKRTDAAEAFAILQKGAGQMEALAQLEEIANRPLGEYDPT